MGGWEQRCVDPRWSRPNPVQGCLVDPWPGSPEGGTGIPVRTAETGDSLTCLPSYPVSPFVVPCVPSMDTICAVHLYAIAARSRWHTVPSRTLGTFHACPAPGPGVLAEPNLDQQTHLAACSNVGKTAHEVHAGAAPGAGPPAAFAGALVPVAAAAGQLRGAGATRLRRIPAEQSQHAGPWRRRRALGVSRSCATAHLRAARGDPQPGRHHNCARPQHAAAEMSVWRPSLQSQAVPGVCPGLRAATDVLLC